jgi:hypothetical protein
MLYSLSWWQHHLINRQSIWFVLRLCLQCFEEVRESNCNYYFFFMFCWPCISIYACNETNLMHYLSSVYSVTITLHVLGLLVAHHQEVTVYVCDNWYMLYTLVGCQRAWPADSQLIHTTHTSCHIYTLLLPDDGLLASPKHIEEQWLNKLKMNSASGWFHYTHNCN